MPMEEVERKRERAKHLKRPQHTQSCLNRLGKQLDLHDAYCPCLTFLLAGINQPYLLGGVVDSNLNSLTSTSVLIMDTVKTGT